MRRLATLCAVAALFSGCVPGQPLLSQSGKTKQQADVELENAWKEGWLPYRRADYPPAQATLERNKSGTQRRTPRTCLYPQARRSRQIDVGLM